MDCLRESTWSAAQVLSRLQHFQCRHANPERKELLSDKQARFAVRAERRAGVGLALGGDYVFNACDYPGDNLADTLASGSHHERSDSHSDRSGGDLFHRASVPRPSGDDVGCSRV